jgi:hypothetical protein
MISDKLVVAFFPALFLADHGIGLFWSHIPLWTAFEGRGVRLGSRTRTSRSCLSVAQGSPTQCAIAREGALKRNMYIHSLVHVIIIYNTLFDQSSVFSQSSITTRFTSFISVAITNLVPMKT